MKPLRVHGAEPPAPLVRLRELQKWILVSRDRLEALESDGKIKPLRKHVRAKALYRKWQFYELLSCQRASPVSGNRTPLTMFVRRLDAVDWLGVTKAEFESWVRCGLIRPLRIRGRAAKAYYQTSEIEIKILGVLPSRPATLEQLIRDLEQPESTPTP